MPTLFHRVRPHAVRSILLASFALLALGCSEPTSEPTRAAEPSGPDTWASVHGRPGARPGSHDDWCGEHQVPESLCTRCNPTLVPAFQASGDWCAEHGLPESQCLVCNPELRIERPPREATP